MDEIRSMRRSRGWRMAALMCVAALAAACSPAATPSSGVTLALTHGTLIDGTGAAPVPDATVLIAGDRIDAVGPAASTSIPAGTRTIDLHGATILPGFINAHVHQGFSESNLRAWAEGGVTTVRDEGASIAQVDGLKESRARTSKDPHLARLVSFGTMLAVPGGYGQRFASSVEEFRLAVEDEYEKGVDGIKIALEDGYAGTHGLPKPTAEELKAVVEAAHAHGLPVSGHATQADYLAGLLDAGVDDVAHMPYDPVPQESFQPMVDDDVYLVPTFTVLRNFNAPGGWVDQLWYATKQGVRVALGNDYAGGPGDFELGIPMYEINTMATAGMDPMDIIVASTRNAAHVSGLDGQVGTLTPGLAADVLVVAGNPLSDPHALERIRLVVHGGTIIRDELSGAAAS
jgi:imidazolonepropionase-like amidohydrolase